MGDGITEQLREQLPRMTTHDWLVRVSELRQAVENRERKIAEHERTIARIRKIGDELRAKVERLEAELAEARAGSPPPSTPRRRRPSSKQPES